MMAVLVAGEKYLTDHREYAIQPRNRGHDALSTLTLKAPSNHARAVIAKEFRHAIPDESCQQFGVHAIGCWPSELHGVRYVVRGLLPGSIGDVVRVGVENVHEQIAVLDSDHDGDAEAGSENECLVISNISTISWSCEQV